MRGSINTAQSGTITAGGTAQQALAGNSGRRYLLIQNNSDTDMWVLVGGEAGAKSTPAAAAPPSVLLPASGGKGLVFEGAFVPTGPVSIFCATTGKGFTVWEA